MEGPWELYVDGSSSNKAIGVCYILVSPEGTEVKGALYLKFKASKEAEYEALLAGVRAAKAMGVHDIKIYSDSQLVVNQVNGEYEARGVGMT